MGVREWANNHTKLASGSLGAFILICAGGIAAEVMGSRHTIKPVVLNHYYSADDGKSFFEAPETNVPPFDYQGTPAVLAHVFTCGAQRFVGYLERYTERVRKLVLAGESVPQSVEHTGHELKKPGDPAWVNSGDMFGVAKVVTVTCPGGGADQPTPIEP
jgi:hypothetical protein